MGGRVLVDEGSAARVVGVSGGREGACCRTGGELG